MEKNKNYEYWNEFLEFITAICVCKNQGVNVNQMIISEVILQSHHLKKKLLVNIEYNKGRNKLEVMLEINDVT